MIQDFPPKPPARPKPSEGGDPLASSSLRRSGPPAERIDDRKITMATIQQFEELLCWKKSRELVRGVYTAFKSCNDYGFRDQIQRASVSIMSNIAEGLKANCFAFNEFCRLSSAKPLNKTPEIAVGSDFESGTRQEFLNYLYIAKGSAGEVRAQLYAANDIGYLNIETFKSLHGLALECSRLVSSFIMSLKRSSVTGLQHKREKTKNQLEQEQFLEESRKELAKTHPEIWGEKE
ncbi:MAG: four helix bundle protein [bacterium]|nr:four helix bundle protein [bacterium]